MFTVPVNDLPQCEHIAGWFTYDLKARSSNGKEYWSNFFQPNDKAAMTYALRCCGNNVITVERRTGLHSNDWHRQRRGPALV